MPRYQRKPLAVDAVQWFKVGDHPAVKPYPHKSIRDCFDCGRPILEHGFIKQDFKTHMVCPGDFVVTEEGGNPYPLKPDELEKLYGAAEGGEG